MEIVIAAAVLAAGLVVAAPLLVRRRAGLAPAASAPRRTGRARAPAEAARGSAGPERRRGARRQEIGRLEERLTPARTQLERRVAELDDARGASWRSARRQPLEAPRAPRPRARARRGPLRLPGQAAAAQGARGPDPPRLGAPRPPDRGGDQARRRPPRAQHPRRRHAAAGRRPRRRDHRLGRPAPRRRHEGPHHRPRGPQHPRPRAPHRRRLHHRRHAERRDPLRLRRRPARDRPHDAGEAAPGRPHPPGADRGDLLPGQVRAREPHHGVRRAGGASTPTSRAWTPS